MDKNQGLDSEQIQNRGGGISQDVAKIVGGHVKEGLGR